ncbi:hypothetical protein [Rhizobium mongolense]|uniref:Uncharacterized protein n=1 Tax=Rhizobium mongolense TaxID=57676 RepID=A0A7W6RSB4_9HYPH|nr:hypothetical protein [Rhizobium mongolense]MBB4277735.1 hypothetical protein [Rhizobium mongolense]
MHVEINSVILSWFASGTIAYAIGFPASKYFDSNIRMRLLIAPVIGLGIFGAAGVSILHLVALTAVNVCVVVITLSAVAFWLSSSPVEPFFRSPNNPSPSWVAVAFLLGLLPAFAIIPQYYGGSASVGAPIWDHAKIAIIDQIAQNGLPPYNPYYSEAGNSPTLIYYYVWHFIAACLAVITGGSGWEADIALTGLTALFSTFVVAWLAVARSSCADAAWWVLPLLLTGSLQSMVRFVSGNWLDTWMVHEQELQRWLFAVTWAPQHVFSGTVALIVMVAYTRVLYQSARSDWVLAVFMGTMLASAYGSSAWAGGLSLILILPIVGILSVPHLLKSNRLLEVAISLSLTVAVAVLCGGILMYEQSSILHTRRVVEVWVYPIFLGKSWFYDIVGFWTVFAILQLGIIFVSFNIWNYWLMRHRSTFFSCVDHVMFISVGILLLCTQFLHSTLYDNDLGWRVLIPAMLIMTAQAAALFSLHMRENTLVGRVTTGTMVMLLAPSILVGAQFIYSTAFEFRLQGPETDLNRAFKASPDMWEAVRQVTPPNEAVANNPLDFASLTPWPGNIAWATLSRRRSCGTTLELLRSYAAQLTPKQASDIYRFFVEVFEGNATEDELRVMKERYRCKTLVVTTRDGLWDKPLLDNNSVYKLVSQQKDNWRIYR